MGRLPTRALLLPVLTVSLTLLASTPALAQARGRAVPRGTVSGPPPGGSVTAPRGVAVPRAVYAPGAPRYGYPVYGYPRYGYGYGYYPYRPYYPYYPFYGGFGFPYYGGFGFSIGFGFGYPYYPWYGAVGYGYPYGPYPYAHPFYPYYGYGYPYDPLTAALRLEVKPREAEVFVDGYRAGTVNDFDGTFQRLRLPPGQYNVVLYLDGFRTVEQQMHLGHGASQHVKLEMEKLAAGESSGPRPVPAPREERPEPQAREPRPDDPRRGRGAPPPDVEVQQEPTPRSFGVIALNVQPIDAEILIDGAPWTVPAGATRLIVQLPEGRHKVEIRKSGFATYAEEVAVQRGRLLALNVSLIRVPGGGSRVIVARAQGSR